MKPVAPCEIEALFGSAARHDSDHLSDVDYLIVDDDPQRLKIRKAWLEFLGMSVSDYSWNRLLRLFEKQTLFALHLKYESKTIYDRYG